MLKPGYIGFLGLALSFCLFTTVLPVQAQQQPAHGPGASGPPMGQYKNDQFHGSRINAISMLNGPMYDSAISDWNTTMASSLSTYRILLNPISRAARVGIQNYDKPYFDSAMNNLSYVIGRLQEIRRQIVYTQNQVSQLIEQAQKLQDDTIEAQGEPGLPLVGTVAEEVVDMVPIAGKAINAAGDEDDRRVQETLYDAHQKKKRFRAWLPRINQMKEQTEALLAQAQQDADSLNAAFQPNVCQVCGQHAQAETPAPRIAMPPSSSLPPQPDLEKINQIIADFTRVAQQAAAQMPQTPPGIIPQHMQNLQPGPKPNDY